MTPDKRVEEMVINFKHWYEGHPYEKPDRQKIMNYLRKELPNTLTQYHQDRMSEVEKARYEERHSLLTTVKAMSWEEKNETPDAIRILKELYDFLEA